MEKKIESDQKKTESATDQIIAVGRAAIEKAQEAVDKAQEAIGKIQQEGSKLLESVTKESERVRAQTQKLAEEKYEEAKEKLGEVKGRATNTLDNLEKIFEDRVSRVLVRLGIPTSDDFQAIAKRLDALNKSVRDLIKAQSAAQAAPAQQKDDLKAISGIGPALESKLNADGIVSYRQIASLTAEDVERIETKVIHSSGRITRDNWIAQARELHFKKYNEQL